MENPENFSEKYESLLYEKEILEKLMPKKAFIKKDDGEFVNVTPEEALEMINIKIKEVEREMKK